MATHEDGYDFVETVSEDCNNGQYSYTCNGNCDELSENDVLSGSWDLDPQYYSRNFYWNPYNVYFQDFPKQDNVFSEVFIYEGATLKHFHSKTFAF